MNATIAPEARGPAADVPPGDAPYRITADEFFRMIEAGILPGGRRLYLWDGEIYEAMAKTVPHAVAFSKANMAFARAVPAGWTLWPENPVALSADRAPLPDLTLVRGSADDYARSRRHPGAGDVGLIVEIAVTSLRADTTTRMEQYARSLVPAYWVVDVAGRRVLSYSSPRIEVGVGSYGSLTTCGPADAVPLLHDGREVARIPVRELLDPEPEPKA